MKFSLIVLTFMTAFLGQGVLLFLHYPQLDHDSGALYRVHPVTYLLILLTLFNLIKYKGYIPKEFLIDNRGYVGITIIILFYSIFRKLSFGAVLDTLIDPILIIYNLHFISQKDSKIIKIILIFFFVSNCCLAILEKIVSIRFFPISEGRWATNTFRSSSFQGHPLNNTLINTFLCLYFIITTNSQIKKLLIMGLGVMASVCYGGRTGLAALIVGVIFVSLKQQGKGISRFLIPVLLISSVCAISYYLIFATEFGERLLEAGLNDDSSEVRLLIYDIFRQFDFQDLIFGRTQDEIDYAMYLEDILIIENFWIIWVLKYGIIFSIILSVQFIKFLLNLLSCLDPYFKYTIFVCFLINASGNLSLATSTMVVNIIALVSIYHKHHISKNSLNQIKSKPSDINL